MTEFLHAIGTGSLSVLWIPVLGWTIAAFLMEGAVRGLSLPPIFRYRLRQCILFALPAGIAAAAVAVGGGWHLWPSTVSGSLPAIASLPSIDVLAGAHASSETQIWTWIHGVGFITLGSAAVSTYFVMALGIEAWRIHFLFEPESIRRDGQISARLRRIIRHHRVSRPVAVRVTSSGTVPMLVPGFPPTILLPDALMPPAGTTSDHERKIEMTLVHEIVHLRRYDDVTSLFERWVVSLAAVHPLVHMLRRSIIVDREILCDAEVLRLLRCRRGSYARLLETVATSRPSIAVCLSESHSTLYHRLEAMTDPSTTSSTSQVKVWSSVLGAFTAVLMGMAGCADAPSSSSSTSVTEAPSTVQEQPPRSNEDNTTSSDEVYVVVETQPRLIGGLTAIQQAIQYPDEARQRGEEGRVFVSFIVQTDGSVSNVEVTRGAAESLNQEAIRVVRNLSFTPGKQLGEAVPVRMALPVSFQLGTSS